MESTGAFIKHGIIRHHCASFAGRDRLVDLHAVDADSAEGADRPFLVGTPQALGAVFEHDDAVPPGDGKDAIHVAGTALQMHRHDGLRLPRYLALQIIGIQVERFVNLGEHGKGAGQHDGVKAGQPGPGGQDDFVAGTNLQRGQGCGQGGRPGGDRQGEPDLHTRSQFLLEAKHLPGRLGARTGPAGRLAVFQHLQQFLSLFRPVVLGAEEAGMKRLVADRRTSFNGQC